MKAVVREIQVRRQEVFVPLVHRPGEAQADVGHALIKQDGVLRKVVFFVFVLPYFRCDLRPGLRTVVPGDVCRGAQPGVRLLRGCAQADHL